MSAATTAVRPGAAESTGPEAHPAAPATVESETPAAPGAAAGPEVVLSVRDLKTYFFTYEGVVRALEGVSFDLRRGETTGLVGETGCGKSVTAMSIARLVADPPGRIFHGHVLIEGADLLRGLEDEATYRAVKGTTRVRVRRRFRRIRRANERMAAIRGRKIAMIFQEPSQALNPVFSIANQVGEIVFLHHGPAVIADVLKATPNAPAVRAALARLEAVPPGATTAELRAFARELGEAAHSPRLETEAFYLLQGPGTRAAKALLLRRAVQRLWPRGAQRSFLAYQRQLLWLRAQSNRIYLDQLRGKPRRSGPELALRLRRGSLRLRHFYFGLWGLNRYVRRPLDDELFWRVVRLLEGVRIANPVLVARGYPHELSGGMIQRVMIAMALSGDPSVLLADEPTTALDVTIQAQVLELIAELRRRVGTAILLITHDLAVVAEVADRVCVMYAGQIVEEGPVSEVFHRPLHPYTVGLLQSIPRVDQPGKELTSIAGSVPDLVEPPSGCRFHPRCPQAMPVCKEKTPPTTVEGPGHLVACYLYHGARVAR